MTPAATPEALEQALTLTAFRVRHPGGNAEMARANDSLGWRASKAVARAIAAEHVAPLLAALQQVTAERDAGRAEHARYQASAEEMWETAKRHGGRMFAEKRRADDAEAALATANAEAASLRAGVEAKDRAILLLLPFVDYAAGEGLMFVETEDGEHPEMDAADIMAAVAEELGLELGSDAYLSLLPKGYFAIRTALARAATAGEG